MPASSESSCSAPPRRQSAPFALGLAPLRLRLFDAPCEGVEEPHVARLRPFTICHNR